MLRTGLIGLPASGKTTLFQLMTSVSWGRDGRRRADAHVGISRVPDVRLDRLTDLFHPKRQVPATVEFTDMPGRTGPHALLDVAAFRQADALLHVARVFRDQQIPHPSGSIDPRRDARAMEEELLLADLGGVERRLQRLTHDLRKTRNEELQREHAVLERCRAALENAVPLRAVELEPDMLKQLRGFQFLSAKPLLLVLNLDESDMPATAETMDALGLGSLLADSCVRSVAVCAKIELEIARLDAADAAVFLQDLGLAESGLNRVIRASYDLLGYVSFFTVGEDECRAWSVPRGTVAQAAARQIHSDIERGFIRAEIVAYEDLIGRGSLVACRAHGEVRLEGKDYVVRDGDVITFRFAT